MQNMVLISILLDLLIKRKVTRNSLSEKYELSTRTITRYITVLTEAGVPIESYPGLGGGYVLPPAYKLDRLIFTPAEYARIAEVITKSAADYDDGICEKILDKIAH